MDLLPFYAEIRSGDTERILNATAAIRSFMSDTETAFQAFMDILKNNSDPNNRILSIIFINFMVKKVPEYSSEFADGVISTVGEILSLESNATVKLNICDVIASLSKDESTIQHSLEIVANLLNDPKQVNYALILLTDLIRTSSIDVYAEFIAENILAQIFDICISENADLRFNGMRLLRKIIKNEDLRDVLNEDDGVGMCSVITAGLERTCGESSDPSEASAVLRLAISARDELFEFNEEQDITFIQECLEIMNKDTLDSIIRLQAAQGIISTIKISIDALDEETVQTIIQTFVELSASLHAEDPDSIDYIFPLDLFDTLCELAVMEDHFQFLIDFAMQLFESEDENHVQVALMIILGLFSSAPDLCVEQEDTIIEIAAAALAFDNDNIVGSAADVIRIMFEKVPENASHHISVLTPLLLQKLELFQVLNALAQLFEASDVPPPDLSEVISTLIGALQETESLKGEFLAIIDAALDSKPKDAAQYYEDIQSILMECLESNEPLIAANAVRCFGLFAYISPSQIDPQLSELIPLLISLLTDSSYELNGEICVTLSALFTILPNSMSIFGGDLIIKLKEVYELEEKEVDNEEEDIEDLMQAVSDGNVNDNKNRKTSRFESYMKMKAAAIKTLCRVCAVSPDAELIQEVFGMIEPMLSVEDSFSLFPACDCLVDLSRVYAQAGEDQSAIVDGLLRVFAETSEVSMASKIFETLTSVIENLDNIENYIDNIGHHLMEVFSHARFGQPRADGEIAYDLQPASFTLLDSIIKNLGPNCSGFVEPFMQFIIGMSQSRRKRSHVRAAHSLSLIAKYTNSVEDAETAASASLEEVSSKSVEVKAVALSSLSVVGRHFPAVLAERREFLSSLADGVLARADSESDFLVESAAALWLALNPTADASAASAVLSRAGPDCDALSLFADFAFAYNSASPGALGDALPALAVAVLAADRALVREVPEEAMALFAHAAAEAGEERILEMLHGDQRRFNAVMQHFQ